MADITGGELLARCLAREGVRFVFGIPCPEVDPLLAAAEANEIRFVPVRHEAAACHMAEGLYKTTGQVGVVLGNPGPGSANLLPGVITARHEGVPLIALTAQHRLGIVYPSPPSTFQGQDQLNAFDPSVKWGGPILSWDRMAEVTRMAFREMWSGRPGPVQLEVTAPIMYEEHDEDTAPILPPEAYRATQPQPSEAQLEQVAELLAAAERPAVVAGSGVDRAGANTALLQLVELLGCPVMPTMAGRAVVPRDHDHYVYGYGAGGDQVRREADVVLVVGSRLGNLDLPYDKYWGDPRTQKIIQIDIDPRHVGVTRPLALGVVAEAKSALEGLVRVLEKRGLRREPSADLVRYRETEQGWRSGPEAFTLHTRCRPSETSSAGRPSTSPTVGTRRSGRTGSCPRHDRAPISTSSSSECSAPGSRRRSARSSATPTAKSSACRATAPPDSTSWRCSRRPARDLT
jgi:acetolactate synthase-1/2/3 large subunit